MAEAVVDGEVLVDPPFHAHLIHRALEMSWMQKSRSVVVQPEADQNLRSLRLQPQQPPQRPLHAY